MWTKLAIWLTKKCPLSIDECICAKDKLCTAVQLAPWKQAQFEHTQSIIISITNTCFRLQKSIGINEDAPTGQFKLEDADVNMEDVGEPAMISSSTATGGNNVVVVSASSSTTPVNRSPMLTPKVGSPPR